MIKAASHSSTGPDGIPFEAFKRVLDLAAEVLHALIRDMVLNDGATLDDTFNAAWLALFPKKP